MNNSRLEIFSIASRIREEILSKLSPGARVPSEQALSDILGDSYNRIHRALQLLLSEGFIASRGFRQGYLLRSREQTSSVNRAETSASLSISLPLFPESAEAQQWRHICNMFTAINPGVTISIHYDSVPNYDLYLTWPPLLNTSQFLPLELNDFLTGADYPPGEMLPMLMQAGVQYGQQFCIPVAYAPAVFWGQRNLLHRQALHVEEFTNPMDYFLWGERLFESKCCPLSLAYLGPSYHASPWGVEYRHEGDYFKMNTACMRQFLEAVMPYLHHAGVLYNPKSVFNLFRRGALALFPDYLSRISLSERRFQLLGCPLFSNGYVNQAIFMLGINRHTPHVGWCREFIRFALTKQAQEALFLPVPKFSVWKILDSEQRERLRNLTGVSVPAFDIRGIFSLLDLDFELFAALTFQQVCLDYFLGHFSLESTLKTLSSFHIPTLRQNLIPKFPEQSLKTHHEFLKINALIT